MSTKTQSKGLKQMVAEAIEQAAKPEPVIVSDEAVRTLSQMMRDWSGWRDSRVQIGDPRPISPYASCNHGTHLFTVNADLLVLNPNKVLLTVTPFRLRQEAVLTGCLLHEAGHARHSRWLPKNRAAAALKPLVHNDGTDPSKQTVALARLMEEARVEGLMALEADRIGATGLAWTMRASAAHLVPVTALSTDPARAIMDLVTSWALRAGRQYALAANTEHSLRHWVQDFTTLLSATIMAHLTEAEARGAAVNPLTDAKSIINTLIEMCSVTDDTGPTMIDRARDVLAWLFPETDTDSQPQPQQTGCGAGQAEAEPEEGDKGEGSEAGEQAQGNTEPEDEGSGDDPGAGDTGDDTEGEPTEEDADGEPTSEDEEDADGEPTSEDEEGSDTDADMEEDEGASDSTDEAEQDSAEPDTESPLAKALAEMEARAEGETEDETEDAAEEAEATAASGAGAGGTGAHGGEWRAPNKDEREIAKGAERFLRDMINPSESSKVTLTDTPSSTVDGAALAAWKAGGQVNTPHFFRRTRRNVVPSPPVKIAVLVDVSSSMEELQAPSAVLSWALSSAALDLRNFAGRGQQVESCLIHWGSDARVIAANGQTLPGIREWECNEGTSAMHEALRLVEEQMPGFFDAPEAPVNRLLVQFTDWELFGRRAVVPQIQQLLAVGVNMLTIAPRRYREGYSDLPAILRECMIQRGTSSLLRYNPMFPDQVWDQAAEVLVK